MPPEEIHKDVVEILGYVSPSYSKVKNRQHSLGGVEKMLKMMDGLAAPKMPPLMKIPRLCTPWLCVIGGETCVASEVGISFGEVQLILTDILLGMSKVFDKIGATNADR